MIYENIVKSWYDGEYESLYYDNGTPVPEEELDNIYIVDCFTAFDNEVNILGMFDLSDDICAVIRCKDCKHYCGHITEWCAIHGHEVSEEGFCYLAETMEEE